MCRRLRDEAELILFITRKHPPSVGGMQQLSYHLTQTVSRQVPAHIISWGRSQKWLPLFIPYALVRALFVLGTRPVTLIHVGDLLLAPLGVLLRFIARRPVVANAHGLDVIYPSRLYQAVVPACVRRLDFVICISDFTREQCLATGIKAQRCRVIPVGVEPGAFRISLSEREENRWIGRWGLRSRPKHMLITVGRLVPRKGVLYLVSRVLPELAQRRDDWAYLVVGDGPQRGAILAEVRERGLDRVVRVLGQVSGEELQAAYALADLFVMPNVPIQEDSEGFGIVTLEARAAGLRVVASALEGIADSCITEDDGILVPPGDAEALLRAIGQLMETELTMEERQLRRDRVEARFGWTRISGEYLAVFREVEAQYYSRPNLGASSHEP